MLQVWFYYKYTNFINKRHSKTVLLTFKIEAPVRLCTMIFFNDGNKMSISIPVCIGWLDKAFIAYDHLVNITSKKHAPFCAPLHNQVIIQILIKLLH